MNCPPPEAVVLGAAGCRAGSGAGRVLRRGGSGWTARVLGSVALVLLLAVSSILPWSRLPARATIAFPAFVCLALVVLNVGAPGSVAPLSGVLTLCFGYLGLTQSQGTSVRAIPFAGARLVVLNGAREGAIAVR